MSQPRLNIYHLLGIFLATMITGCGAPKIVTQPSSAIPPTVINPPVTIPPPSPARPNREETYQQASIKADAAKAIGQSAISKDDWLLVAQNLEDSVQMLKSIEQDSSQYTLASQAIPKYEEQLAKAKQKATNYLSKSTPTTIKSHLASIPPTGVFSIPIQQKLGGVAVIEVTMDNQRISMFLDTGASHTLITPSIAKQLNLKIDGTAQANTANGSTTFEVGTIDKIKFGSGEANQIRVSIGQKDLPFGLLGHDVYDGYDITIKENSIEFRKR